ncbi:hypothetical protein IGS59_27370 [Janthinobacterium sp. GW460P]|uniref:hypothetical protein n=1 Tax=unclassified Janthinobacterium TaxID=2610881 RepID=UPI000A31F319|nr:MULTISPECIES: hypothetical protein [unclassified Janthinobacterium]MCC7705972.1 hypothetical protein [Janthinobacterium sp. GW460P]MCC7711474.1 hypothetical protein [Janthinobacterium sp. GW460W]
MTQPSPRKRHWTTKSLLAIFCLVPLAWYALPRNQPVTELRMTVNGNMLLIPANYIPSYMQGLYEQASNRQGLLLQAQWKGGKLQPFIAPHDNTPVWISHQDEVSILVQHFDANTLAEKYQLAQHFSAIWMPNRKQVASRHGLLRYEHNDLPQRVREDAITVFYEQDLYLYPSRERIETQIVCAPDFFPDPGTERANALEKRGKLVIGPSCSHDIFLHGLRNSHIRVSYFRSHLHEWQAIERAVVALLDSLIQEPQKALPLARQRDAQRESGAGR